jgi:pimeloyl-ACP methyl ester carboxylesterase
VLLPGLDGTGLLFRPLLAALPPELGVKVIAYPATEALGLPELAQFVARQLPAEKTVLLAESFSGLVALTLLMSASARIHGVIFVGAFAEPPRPLLLRLAPLVSRSAGLMRSAPSFLLRQYCIGKEATAADVRMMREAIGRVSPEVLAQRLKLVATRHSFDKAPIKVPSCYLRPSEDRLVPPSCATWFEQRFRRCDIVEAEGPHFLLQARPRQCAQIITGMLRSLRDGLEN